MIIKTKLSKPFLKILYQYSYLIFINKINCYLIQKSKKVSHTKKENIYNGVGK